MVHSYKVGGTFHLNRRTTCIHNQVSVFDEVFQRNLFNKIAAVTDLPALKGLKSKLDPRKFNGAILLGLRGIVIKSHSGTDDIGFSYALEEAYHEAKSASLSKIEQGVAEQLVALETIKEQKEAASDTAE